MYEAEVVNVFIDSLIADINHLKAKIERLEKENAEFKAEIEKLAKSDASKEQSSIEYYNLYKNLKRENAELKTRLEKQDKLIDDFIDHLAWENAKFAAFEAGLGNPSVGAVSQYRKPYEEILQELKEKGADAETINKNEEKKGAVKDE
jgi:predicted RNase H-like nuclease (RuvC/YqgF family)